MIPSKIDPGRKDYCFAAFKPNFCAFGECTKVLQKNGYQWNETTEVFRKHSDKPCLFHEAIRFMNENPDGLTEEKNHPDAMCLQGRVTLLGVALFVEPGNEDNIVHVESCDKRVIAALMERFDGFAYIEKTNVTTRFIIPATKELISKFAQSKYVREHKENEDDARLTIRLKVDWEPDEHERPECAHQMVDFDIVRRVCLTLDDGDHRITASDWKAIDRAANSEKLLAMFNAAEPENIKDDLRAKKTEMDAKNGVGDGHKKRLRYVDACDMTVKPLIWLWRNRIPCGGLTLINGQPGAGKSALAMDIAARVTTGRDFPPKSDPQPCERGRVIIITNEDDKERVILPRFLAAGGDPKMLRFILDVYDEDAETAQEWSVDDIPETEKLIKETPDVKLLIIDPIMNYMGEGRDVNRQNVVVSALAPLHDLADRYNLPIILVSHTRKAESDDKDDSVMGSKGFISKARALFHVCRDPKDKSRVLFIPGTKNNWSGEKSALAYELKGKMLPEFPVLKDTVPYVVWEENPTDETAESIAEDAMSKKAGRPKNDKITAWLNESFIKEWNDGVDQSIIVKAARKQGFGRSTMYERLRKMEESGVIHQKSSLGSVKWIPGPAKKENDAAKDDSAMGKDDSPIDKDDAAMDDKDDSATNEEREGA